MERRVDIKRPPPIELRQLHAFRVVAQELHYGRAADRLGIAQPPLSQMIKRLEQVLDCKLFDRDTRRVELTPAGVAFRDMADAVLARLHAGIERVGEIASGEAGRLAVGFTPTTALHILPRVVRAFRGEYAGVEIILSELLPDAMRDRLLTEQIDIALMREPTPVDGIEAIAISDEPFVAVLPGGHALADPAVPFRLEALAGEPFVLFPRDQASQGLPQTLALCAEAGFVPDVVQEVPGWQTAISLVGSGLGVSILPESVISLHLPGIAYRSIASPIRSRSCLLRRTGDDRPMVRNFIARGLSIMRE